MVGGRLAKRWIFSKIIADRISFVYLQPMTKCAPVWRLLLSLFLAFSFAGCSQFKRSGIADEKDPHFLDGKRRVSGLDYAGAIEAFERALQSNPNNAAAHFELGLIFEGRANDQAAAIYHFQKYQNLYTNSPKSELVTQKINYAKRTLATQHAPALVNRTVQHQLEQLVATNEFYRNRLLVLEAEIARGPRYITNYVTNYFSVDKEESRSRSMTWPTKEVEAPPQTVQTDDPPPRTEIKSAQAAVKQAPAVDSTPKTLPTGSSKNLAGSSEPRSSSRSTRTPKRAEPAPTTRTHRVAPGDTMQVLARRYGISVAELKAANPGMGNGTRAGQTLNIPAK